MLPNHKDLQCICHVLPAGHLVAYTKQKLDQHQTYSRRNSRLLSIQNDEASGYTFYKKANFLNDFFGKLCSTIVDNNFRQANLTLETENRLSAFDFSTGDIKSLDPNKAHGHDEISICMIKLYAFNYMPFYIKTFTFSF